MSSSLFNSPLRKQADNQKAEDPKLQKKDSLNIPLPIRSTEVPADANTNQIKNPLQHLWQETKNCIWHAPKAVEAAVCLAVTAVISLVSVAVYCKKGSVAAWKFKNDCLESVVEKSRSICNQYIYCGSLFDHQKSFLKQSDGELKDNLNPLKWLGESLMSACMYALDWSRSSFTRFTLNLVSGKNLSAEEFREYEYQNTPLRLIKNSFDLAKGFLSLFVIRKINSGKSLKDLIRPLGVATGMSAASAVGEKWQEGKSALNLDTAEQILAGSSNSLAFMGLMQTLSFGYVNRATNFQEKISRSLKAQNFTEFYDLRDSIPDLVNALHKARHDLWDKDTGKPRDKWAILGHLLSTGAAASDAAELKASGLSKLSIADKNGEIANINSNGLPFDLKNISADPLQLPKIISRNEKLIYLGIAEIRALYQSKKEQELLTFNQEKPKQEQLSLNDIKIIAAKKSRNILAFVDRFEGKAYLPLVTSEMTAEQKIFYRGIQIHEVEQLTKSRASGELILGVDEETAYGIQDQFYRRWELGELDFSKLGPKVVGLGQAKFPLGSKGFQDFLQRQYDDQHSSYLAAARDFEETEEDAAEESDMDSKYWDVNHQLCQLIQKHLFIDDDSKLREEFMQLGNWNKDEIKFFECWQEFAMGLKAAAEKTKEGKRIEIGNYHKDHFHDYYSQLKELLRDDNDILILTYQWIFVCLEKPNIITIRGKTNFEEIIQAHLSSVWLCKPHITSVDFRLRNLLYLSLSQISLRNIACLLQKNSISVASLKNTGPYCSTLPSQLKEFALLDQEASRVSTEARLINQIFLYGLSINYLLSESSEDSDRPYQLLSIVDVASDKEALRICYDKSKTAEENAHTIANIMGRDYEAVLFFIYYLDLVSVDESQYQRKIVIQGREQREIDFIMRQHLRGASAEEIAEEINFACNSSIGEGSIREAIPLLVLIYKIRERNLWQVIKEKIPANKKQSYVARLFTCAPEAVALACLSSEEIKQLLKQEKNYYRHSYQKRQRFKTKQVAIPRNPLNIEQANIICKTLLADIFCALDVPRETTIQDVLAQADMAVNYLNLFLEIEGLCQNKSADDFESKKTLFCQKWGFSENNLEDLMLWYACFAKDLDFSYSGETQAKYRLQNIYQELDKTKAIYRREETGRKAEQRLRLRDLIKQKTLAELALSWDHWNDRPQAKNKSEFAVQSELAALRTSVLEEFNSELPANLQSKIAARFPNLENNISYNEAIKLLMANLVTPEEIAEILEIALNVLRVQFCTLFPEGNRTWNQNINYQGRAYLGEDLVLLLHARNKSCEQITSTINACANTEGTQGRLRTDEEVAAKLNEFLDKRAKRNVINEVKTDPNLIQYVRFIAEQIELSPTELSIQNNKFYLPNFNGRRNISISDPRLGILTLFIRTDAYVAPEFTKYPPFAQVYQDNFIARNSKLPALVGQTLEYFIALADFINDSKDRHNYLNTIFRIQLRQHDLYSNNCTRTAEVRLRRAIRTFIFFFTKKTTPKLKTRRSFRKLFQLSKNATATQLAFQDRLDFFPKELLDDLSTKEVQEMLNPATGVISLLRVEQNGQSSKILRAKPIFELYQEYCKQGGKIEVSGFTIDTTLSLSELAKLIPDINERQKYQRLLKRLDIRKADGMLRSIMAARKIHFLLKTFLECLGYSVTKKLLTVNDWNETLGIDDTSYSQRDNLVTNTGLKVAIVNEEEMNSANDPSLGIRTLFIIPKVGLREPEFLCAPLLREIWEQNLRETVTIPAFYNDPKGFLLFLANFIKDNKTKEEYIKSIESLLITKAAGSFNNIIQVSYILAGLRLFIGNMLTNITIAEVVTTREAWAKCFSLDETLLPKEKVEKNSNLVELTQEQRDILKGESSIVHLLRKIKLSNFNYQPSLLMQHPKIRRRTNSEEDLPSIALDAKAHFLAYAEILKLSDTERERYLLRINQIGLGQQDVTTILNGQAGRPAFNRFIAAVVTLFELLVDKNISAKELLTESQGLKMLDELQYTQEDVPVGTALSSEEQWRLESELENHPFIKKFEDYLQGRIRLKNISSIYEQGSDPSLQQVVLDISAIFTEDTDQLNKVSAEFQDRHFCIVRSRHNKSQLVNAAFVLVKDEKQGYTRHYVPVLLVPEGITRDYWKNLAFQLVLLHSRNYLESDILCPLAIKHQQENTPEIVNFVLSTLRLTYPEVNFELREVEEIDSDNQRIKVSEIVPTLSNQNVIISREFKRYTVNSQRENLARLTFFAVAKRYETVRREQRNINERIVFCFNMAMSYGQDGSAKAYDYAKQALEDLPSVALALKITVISKLISYISSQKNQDKGKTLEILERIINEIIVIEDEDKKCQLLITYVEALTRLNADNLDLNLIAERLLGEARTLPSFYSKVKVLLSCLEVFIALKLRIEDDQLLNLLKECYQEAKKVETPHLRVEHLENCFTLMTKIQAISTSQELIEFCRKDIIKDIRRTKKENKVEASKVFIAYIESAAKMNLPRISWVKLIERGISLFDDESKTISPEEVRTIRLYFELIPKLGEAKLGKDIDLLYEKLLNKDLYYLYPELFGSLINLANAAGGPLLEQFMLRLFSRFDRVRYPKIEFTFLIKYLNLLLNKSISKEKLFPLYKKVLAEIGKHSLVDRETHLCINNFLVSIKQRRNELSKADLQILCRMTLLVLRQLLESSHSEDVILQFMETLQFLAENGFKDELLPIFPEILDTIRSLKEVKHHSYPIKEYLKIVCKLKLEQSFEDLVALFKEGLIAADGDLPNESVYVIVYQKYIDLIADNSFKKIAGLQYAFCQEVLNAIENAPLNLRMQLLTHFTDLIRIHGGTLVEIKDQVEKIAKNICIQLLDDIYTLISYINILQKLTLFTAENKAVPLCNQVLNKIRVLKDREQVKKLLKEYFFAIQFLGAEALGEDLFVVCKNVKEFILGMEDNKEKAELLIDYIDFVNDLQIVYPRADFEDLCRVTLELILSFPINENASKVILLPANHDRITILRMYIEKLSQDKANHKLLLKAINALFSEITKYEGTERVVEIYPEVLIDYFNVLDQFENDILGKVLNQQSSRLIILSKIKPQQNDSSLKCYLDLILKLPPDLLSSILNRHYNKILSVVRNLDDESRCAAISEFIGFVGEFDSKAVEGSGLLPPINYLKDVLELIETLSEDEKVRQLVEFLNIITEIKEKHSSSLELVELYNKGLKKLLLIDHLSDYSDNNIRQQLLVSSKFQFNENILRELIQLRNPKILKEVGLVFPHFADSYVSKIRALRVIINQRMKIEIAEVREHQQIKAIRSRIILEETANFLDLSIEQVKENELDQIEQMLTFGILESREAIPDDRSKILTRVRAKQKQNLTVDSEYHAASYRDALGMRGQTYEEVSQLCSAVGTAEHEAINTLSLQIAVDKDKNSIEKLQLEKNYREKRILRYLEALIDSNNQKGISYVLQWIFNENLSAKRREYLIRKLFDIGYWDQKLGQYLSDNYRAKNYQYQQYQKEYHYKIIKALCTIGIAPELSVFKLLESSNDSLKAASLEERVEELAKKKKEYEDKTKEELIELLKIPEEAVIYYACFGGLYSYQLVKNFDWTKLHRVMEKVAEIEETSANADVFEASLIENLGEEKSKEIMETAFSGKVPLLSPEVNEFDLKITEDKIGFTREDLDKQCADIWTRQLVQIISSLVTGRRPNNIAELRNVARNEISSHSMPDDFRTKVEKLLDELSEITTIEKQESYLEEFRKSNPALASVSKQDLIALYIKERILGIGFVAHSLFFEWHAHVNTLVEQNTQLKNEIRYIKKNQTFKVRFIDKVKDLIAAIRFKDGMYSCINSSKDTEDDNELGNEYYTVMSQMYADAFSFMVDIRNSDSPDVIGSVGIRMGIDPIDKRPVVMLQGIYCENKGPAFVNSLLELIEIQLARTLKAGKIILANQYGGSLFYTPLGYKKLEGPESIRINAISSIADTSCYDDIGTVRNGLFKFSDGFVKELEYGKSNSGEREQIPKAPTDRNEIRRLASNLADKYITAEDPQITELSEDDQILLFQEVAGTYSLVFFEIFPQFSLKTQEKIYQLIVFLKKHLTMEEILENFKCFGLNDENLIYQFAVNHVLRRSKGIEILLRGFENLGIKDQTLILDLATACGQTFSKDPEHRGICSFLDSFADALNNGDKFSLAGETQKTEKSVERQLFSYSVFYNCLSTDSDNLSSENGELYLNPKYFQVITIAEPFWIYALANSGVPKIKEFLIANLPWADAILKIGDLHQPQRRSEYDPWRKEIPKIFSCIASFTVEDPSVLAADDLRISEGIVFNLSDSNDGMLIHDYIKTFGLFFDINLFYGFIKLRRAKSVEDLNENLKIALQEFIAEPLESFRTPLDLIKALEKRKKEILFLLLSDSDEIFQVIKSKIGLALVKSIIGSGYWVSLGSLEEVCRVLEESEVKQAKNFVMPTGHQESVIEVNKVFEKDIPEEKLQEKKEQVFQKRELGKWVDNKELKGWIDRILITVDQHQDPTSFCLEQKDKALLSIEKRLNALTEKNDPRFSNQIEVLRKNKEALEKIRIEWNAIIFLGHIVKDLNIELSEIKELLFTVSAYTICSDYTMDHRFLVDEAMCSGDYYLKLKVAYNIIAESILPHDFGLGIALVETEKRKQLLKALKRAWGLKDAARHPIFVAKKQLDDIEKSRLGISDEKDSLSLVPSRKFLRVVSGDLGDACYNKLHLQLAQGEYPNLTSYTFVTNRNNVNGNLKGSVLAIETRTPTGDGVLLVRGNNPAQNLSSKFDTDSLIEEALNAMIALAKRKKLRYVVVPLDAKNASGSNREFVHDYYHRKYAESPKLELVRSPETEFNGYPNWNPNGPCPVVVIWENDSKEG